MVARLQLPSSAPDWARSLALQIDKASRMAEPFIDLPAYISTDLPDPARRAGALIYNRETGEVLFSNGATWVSATGASGAVLGLNLVDGQGNRIAPDALITSLGQSASTASVGGRAAAQIVTSIDNLVETYGNTIAAAQSAANSEAARLASEAARLASDSARQAAIVARNEAQAASTSAGQQASIASANALSAQTAAGSAEIARTQAAASASSANAASVSASEQQTLAVRAAGDALIAAANLFPANFAADGRYFSAQLAGITALPDLAVEFANITEGRVAVITAENAIRPKGARALVPERVYRVSARLRRRGGIPAAEIRVLGLNADGSVATTLLLTAASAPVSVIAGADFVNLAGDYTASAGGPAWISGHLRVSGSGAIELLSFGFADVTDAVTAAGSASAAQISRLAAVDAQNAAGASAAQARLSEAISVISSRSTGFLRDPLFLTGIDGFAPVNQVTLVESAAGRAIQALANVNLRWPGIYPIAENGRVDVSCEVTGAANLAIVWRRSDASELRQIVSSGSVGRIGAIAAAPAETVSFRVEVSLNANTLISRPQITLARSEQTAITPFIDPQDAQITRILSDRIARSSEGLARDRVEIAMNGASAVASTALAASVGVDGRLSAIAGLETVVAGRSGGIVVTNDGSFAGVQVKADGFFVRNTAGDIVATFRDAANGGIELADTMIRSLLVTPDGGGPAHKVALRPRRVTAAHGQRINYPSAYGGIPLVEYAGVPPALLSGETFFIGAEQATSSGFVARAVKFVPGSTNSVSTGAGSNVGGTPSWRVNKPNGGNSRDNNYVFSGSASLPFSSSQSYGPGFTISTYTGTVSFYVVVNGVPTLLYSRQFSVQSNGINTGLREISFSETVQIAMDLSINGVVFGVHAESNAAITALSNVTYTTQSESETSVLPGQFAFDVTPPG